MSTRQVIPNYYGLYWALKTNWNKFGCGLGLCGACTVHMNGEAVRSCQIELSDAEGTQITTIEGLGANGHHPVQKLGQK